MFNKDSSNYAQSSYHITYQYELELWTYLKLVFGDMSEGQILKHINGFCNWWEAEGQQLKVSSNDRES